MDDGGCKADTEHLSVKTLTCNEARPRSCLDEDDLAARSRRVEVVTKAGLLLLFLTEEGREWEGSEISEPLRLASKASNLGNGRTGSDGVNETRLRAEMSLQHVRTPTRYKSASMSNLPC